MNTCVQLTPGHCEPQRERRNHIMVIIIHQVSQLQKRLKSSYTFLREAERQQQDTAALNRELSAEVEELRLELKRQALRTAGAQRTAVVFKERAMDRELAVRVFFNWARAARAEAVRRSNLLHRLATIHEVHAIAVQRRAFDAWGEVRDCACVVAWLRRRVGSRCVAPCDLVAELLGFGFRLPENHQLSKTA